MQSQTLAVTMSALTIVAAVAYGCARNDQQARAPSDYDNTGMGGSSNTSGTGTTANTTTPAPSMTTTATTPSGQGGGPPGGYDRPEPGTSIDDDSQDLNRVDGGVVDGGPGSPGTPGEGNNRYDAAGMMP